MGEIPTYEVPCSMLKSVDEDIVSPGAKARRPLCPKGLRDKTKIGQNVKAEATIWRQFQRENPDDTEEDKKRKKFLNSILAEKKPYFFRYKYKSLSKEYNEFIRKHQEDSVVRFGKTLQELLDAKPKTLTQEEKDFVEYYYHFLPVVDSDCVMNKICKYIENVDFHTRQKVRSPQQFDYRVLVSENFSINKKLYAEIKNTVQEFFRGLKAKREGRQDYKIKNPIGLGAYENENGHQILLSRLQEITSNAESLANHLVYLFYVDKPSYNKNVLWDMIGDTIYEIVKAKTNAYYFPMKNENGSLEFLYEKYSIERVVIPHDVEEEEVDD